MHTECRRSTTDLALSGVIQVQMEGIEGVFGIVRSHIAAVHVGCQVLVDFRCQNGETYA